VRILLIEDHQTVAANIRTYLTMHDFVVSVAHDGKEGLDLAMTETFDLLILDINLPSMDGYTVCAQLRQRGKTMPILMLTARGKQEETVKGLNLGADDYLAKPFDLDVLLARVRALLRRSGTKTVPILTAGPIRLDTNTREVWKGRKKITLSPKEYALLEFLARQKGITQDRPTILEHVWGQADALMFSNTVDVHVAFLRRKLGKKIIRTIPNKGYLLPVD